MKKTYILLILIAISFLGCSKTDENNSESDKVSTDKPGEEIIQNVRIDTVKVEPIIDHPNEYTFEGVLPKISGLNNKDFEEELNRKLLSNVNDYKRKTTEWGGVNAFSGFEVLTNNGTIISIVQSVGWVAYGANGYGFDAYVLNADIKNNKLLKNGDLGVDKINVSSFNRTVLNFFKNEIDYMEPNEEGIPHANNTNDLMKYNFCVKNDDLVLVEYADPGARASQSVYIIPIKKFGSDDNSVSSFDETNTGSSDASEPSAQVSKWINALGSQDFKIAFNLMSGSIRGNYDNFSSPKQYGGITSTKIHSVETVNSSGCIYEVIAVYDSYDPANRDGKYTQRFSINNCNGSWEITKIKNVNIEYFKK